MFSTDNPIEKKANSFDSKNQDALTNRLSQALSIHQSGQYKLAERLYLGILSDYPFQANASHNLGILFLDNNETEKSLPYLKSALESYPEERQYWISYVDALIRAGQNNNARAILDLASRSGLDGEEVKDLYTRLEVTQDIKPNCGNENKELVEAENHPAKQNTKPSVYKKESRKHRSSPGFEEINKLIDLFNQGRTDDAKELAKDLTNRFPNHGFGWKVLGAIYLDGGLQDEALEPLTKAATLIPNDPEAHYNLANVLYDKSLLNKARFHFEKAVNLNPSFAKAYFNLGNVLKDLGELNKAELSYKRAMKIDPDNEQMQFSMAHFLYEQGRYEEAVNYYRISLELRPNQVEAYVNLGVTLKLMRNYPDAEKCYLEAIKIDPNHEGAYNNLGNLFKDTGRIDEARVCFEKAIELKQDYSEAYNNLGVLFKEQGQYKDAELCYIKAINIDPLSAESHNNLGAVLEALCRYKEAEVCCRKAIKLKSSFSNAYNNLGIALHGMGRFIEAEEAYLKALEIEPQMVTAISNLSVTLNSLGRIADSETILKKGLEIDPNYVNFHINLTLNYLDQGKIKEAERSSLEALRIEPDSIKAYSNLLFAMNYLDDHKPEELLSIARQYGSLVTKKVKNKYSKWLIEPDAKKIRIGMVSGDLRKHAVSYFLENILKNIDLSKIELIAYPTGNYEDEVTKRLKAYFSRWTPLVGMDDELSAKTIHSDNLNILIDLSGHTAGNRLPVFAWKPAPVQVSWLGFFATTGVNEMDYFLADEVGVPQANQTHFTEKIRYLPNTRLCFTPPDVQMDISELPALRRGYVTFGCFQNRAKVTDEVISKWSEVIHATPNSRFRWQCKSFTDSKQITQTLKIFEGFGIPSKNVDLLGSVSREAYFSAHAEVDMILDSFPFTGGTTTCEALWMGVPTLTYAGNTLIARQGASLMASAGMEDWIVWDKMDYAAKAILFASDLNKLSELRHKLRSKVQVSALFDGKAFARNMERILKELWIERLEQNRDALIDSHKDNVSEDQTVGSGHFHEESNVPVSMVEEKQPDFETAVDEVMSLAQIHQKNSEFAQAEKLYLEILRLMPNHALANHNLGVIETSTKGAVEALPRFEKAVMAFPDNEQFWVSYIDALAMSGAHDTALSAIKHGQNYGLSSKVADILAKEIVDEMERLAKKRDEQSILLFKEAKAAMEVELNPSVRNKIVPPINSNQDPVFYIYAPDFIEFSSGIKTLHLLCDQLNRQGYEAYITASRTGDRLICPQVNTQMIEAHKNSGRLQIAVYPEVQMGNPLKIAHVIRYLLNKPNFFLKTSWFGSFHENEKVLHYHGAFAIPWIKSECVRVPTVDRNLFKPPEALDHVRSGYLVYSHRVVPDLEKIPEWCKPYQLISMKKPLTPKELAKLYQESEGMVVFERTAAALEAMLCGCPVIFCSAYGLERSSIYYEGFNDFGSVWDFDKVAFDRLKESVHRLPDIYDENEVINKQGIIDTFKKTIVEFQMMEFETVETTPAFVLAKADGLAREGHNLEAIISYRQLILDHPSTVEAYLRLGMILANAGLLSESKEILSQGAVYLSGFPKHPSLDAVRKLYYLHLIEACKKTHEMNDADRYQFEMNGYIEELT